MDWFGLASDLDVRMAALPSIDDEDRRGQRMRGGGRGDAGRVRFGGSGVRMAPDDDLRRRSQGGSGLLMRGGAAAQSAKRSASSLAGSGARPQAAVVKLASYAAGRRRVGALSDYLSRDGALSVETEAGRRLQGRAEIAEELSRWEPGFENRSPSKDVASLIIRAPDAALEAMRRALGAALSGRRFALQPKEDESCAWRVVAVLTGPDGRLDVSAKGRRALGATIARELGAPGDSVTVALTSAGHGASGLSYRLARMISRGPIALSDGRTLNEPAEASAAARDWGKGLNSRKVRDVLHLVLSAKPGTDERAFQETARAFFANQFEGHRYLFAIHRDRQHQHAHAVIVMRDDSGRKLDPKIRDFAAWREAYAAHAREHGIDMVATRRLQRAAVPAYKLKDIQLVERSASRGRTAPDRSRRRIEAKRQDAVHVPTRSEGRAAIATARREFAASAAHPHAKADRKRLEIASVAATFLGELRSMFSQARANQQEVSMANRSPDEMRSDLTRMNEAATKIALLLPAQTRGQFHALANPILERAAEHLDRAMSDGRSNELRDRAERVAGQENREARDAALVAETARRAASSVTRNEGPGSRERADAVVSAAERSAARERQEAIAATRVAAELARNTGQAANPALHEPESVRKLREEQARIVEERVRAKGRVRGREDEL